MRQHPTLTVSIRSVRPVLARLETLGLDVAGALSAAGIDRTAFADAEARIPHVAALAFWREAALRSEDDGFGIHVAESIRPGALDVLDYAIRASATLGEGFERLVRYHRILHDTAVVELRLDGDAAWLTHALPPAAPAVPRQVAEFIVAAWLVVARQATAFDFAPLDVTFRHAAPPDTAEHDRVFRAPLRFSGSVNGLRIERRLLATPLVKADPGLCAVLDKYTRELLERVPGSAAFAERASRVVAAGLSTGVAADDVARTLHMSTRTLHRQLAGEGTSFKQLVDDLRRALATRYLDERRIAIAEIAFLLGFSEASAFHRAFKRWFGSTPADYRKRPAVTQ